MPLFDPDMLKSGLQGLMGAAGNQQPPAPPVERGLLGNIQNFFTQNRGEGNFVNRLGMFGAELQDLEDGGQRARTMQADRSAQSQAQTQAQEAAQQRTQLNKLALGLGLSPQEQLIFQAQPEAFIKILADRQQDVTIGNDRVRNGEVVYDGPDESYMNTSRGVYRTGDNPGWAEQFEPQPDDAPEGMRWNAEGTGYEIIPGYVENRRTISGANRAPPRPRSSGGRSSAPASVPPWEMF